MKVNAKIHRNKFTYGKNQLPFTTNNAEALIYYLIKQLHSYNFEWRTKMEHELWGIYEDIINPITKRTSKPQKYVELDNALCRWDRIISQAIQLHHAKKYLKAEIGYH